MQACVGRCLFVSHNNIKPSLYLLQKRCASKSPPSKPSRFSRVFQAIKGIIEGDDDSDHLKILERKQIYSILLALRYREVVLYRLFKTTRTETEPSDLPSVASSILSYWKTKWTGKRAPELNADTVTATKAKTLTTELHNRCREEAIFDLETLDLDNYTNGQLRRELQDALYPQVLNIFKAFDQADQQLDIPFDQKNGDGTKKNWISSVVNEFKGDQDNDDQQQQQQQNNSSMIDLDKINWTPYVDILNKEKEEMILNINEASNENVQSFLNRKMSALITLLNFHDVLPSSNDINLLLKNSEDDDAFGVDLKNKSPTSQISILQHQTINMCRSILIKKHLGYSVLCLQSTIPNAGRGLFLDGKAFAGSILAFQPGQVWLKEYIIDNQAHFSKYFSDNPNFQVRIRYDDHIIDARNSPAIVLTQSTSQNPWALGHMINHPSVDKRPNCQLTQLNFTLRMKLGNQIRYIPNSYARPPTFKTRFFDVPDPVVMHSQCFVAKRNAENEELFLDYELQSSNAPNWYSNATYQN